MMIIAQVFFGTMFETGCHRFLTYGVYPEVTKTFSQVSTLIYLCAIGFREDKLPESYSQKACKHVMISCKTIRHVVNSY